MARCGCGIQCGCRVVAGDNVTVDGSGSASNPYVISAEVTCDQVRPCLQAGPGIEYDPATGTIAADLSETPGNTLVIDEGGLYVPAASGAQVVAGCGVTGDGTTGAPLTAATGTWPYECDVDTAAGLVYCDSTGQLRAEPRGQIHYQQVQQVDQVDDAFVPTGTNNVIATHELTVTNPDACRPAFLIVEWEQDVDLTIPPGSGAAIGMGDDTVTFTQNTGDRTIVNEHHQTSRVITPGVQTIPPSGSYTISVSVTAGRPVVADTTTYSRVQTHIRAWLIIL